jgi:hypothetical protein
MSENSYIEILQNSEDLVFARIPSRRFPNTKHNVFYNKVDKIAVCDCEGWFNNKKCWHVEALILLVDSLADSVKLK